MNAWKEASDCVIDASVGIMLFVAEPLSDSAHVLFARLTLDSPPRFYIPDLFYIECTNVLWKYVRRYGLYPEDATAHVAQLHELALVSIPTVTLLADAFRFAVEHDRTVYDAVYVALALQLDLPLITADRRLANALRGAAHDVRWLGES